VTLYIFKNDYASTSQEKQGKISVMCPNFWTLPTFGMGETTQFIFAIQTDHDEYSQLMISCPQRHAWSLRDVGWMSQFLSYSS